VEIRTGIKESGRLRRQVMKAVAAAVDAVLSDIRSTDDAELSDIRSTDDAELSDIRSTVKGQAAEWPLAVCMFNEGEGVPVLLLHGFTRSAASWERIASRFTGHPVFALDLMGHGNSPVPDAQGDDSAYTLEAAADRIEAFCARWGCSSIHLVGYSLGGRTAMTYAARHPGRLRTLALLSAHPGIEDEGERAARRESDSILAERITAEGLDAFVTFWSDGEMFASQRDTDPMRWQRVMDDRLAQRARGLAASLRGSGQGSQHPLWEALAGFDVPMLIAAGEKDARYAALSERLRQLLPAAHVEVLPDAGHDLLFDREDVVVDMLQELWKRT
jgi:2-succinyl-6-hydroxy-2,4-cyclohexadiene-1-carboxylate synthase